MSRIIKYIGAFKAGVQAVKAINQPPAIKFGHAWVHKLGSQLIDNKQVNFSEKINITKKILKSEDVTIAFHGSSEIEQFVDQANSTPDNSFRSRQCENGSSDAGLYIAATPEFVTYYTGASTVAVVGVEDRFIKLDSDRGTLYVLAHTKLVLLAVLRVDNQAELKAFKKPSRLTSIKLFATEFLKNLPTS